MILYIDGPKNGGEGVYALISEDGEHLASHFCSNETFAPGDLESRRPERQAEWKARFGEYEVRRIPDAETRRRLVRKSWERAHAEGHAEGDEERCPLCKDATAPTGDARGRG